jgi:hypothetical protein
MGSADIVKQNPIEVHDPGAAGTPAECEAQPSLARSSDSVTLVAPLASRSVGDASDPAVIAIGEWVIPISAHLEVAPP